MQIKNVFETTIYTTISLQNFLLVLCETKNNKDITVLNKQDKLICQLKIFSHFIFLILSKICKSFFWVNFLFLLYFGTLDIPSEPTDIGGYQGFGWILMDLVDFDGF